MLPLLSLIKLQSKFISLSAWVTQPVKRPTAAQIMISWFMSSSPTSGSALTVQSLLGILSPPLSLPLPTHTRTLSLSSK